MPYSHFHLYLLSTAVSFLPITGSISIRAGTFNLWNVMFNWEERLQSIASTIKDHKVDIAAFQEVRFTTSAAGLKTSQLELAKKHLPQHKWNIARPAGKADRPKYAYWDGWTEEGLGILSTFPIEKFTEVNITSARGKDTNPRLALHAEIRVSTEPPKLLHVVAIHFSYDRNQQCLNSEAILNYIAFKNLKDVIVLGDFNAYPDFSGPVELFISSKSADCKQSRARAAPLMFTDAAMVTAARGRDQLTFSNMPSPGLVSRPDRILASSSLTVSDTWLAGYGASYKADFYTSILLTRARAVLQTGLDSLVGRSGYPCLHDCGPHGSCRCGVCVAGGNLLNCQVPNCAECSSLKFVAFVVFLVPVLTASAMLCFYVLKFLVVSAKFSQDDLFDILGYRCCLFNKRLFRFRYVPLRLKLRLGWMLTLFRLPPLPMIVLLLLSLVFFRFLFFTTFRDAFTLIYSILPEELFPSDHLVVLTDIKVL